MMYQADGPGSGGAQTGFWYYAGPGGRGRFYEASRQFPETSRCNDLGGVLRPGRA